MSTRNRPRRRRTGLVAFLVLGALLAVALAVGDGLARTYAQQQVAQRLRTQLGMTSEPSVAIRGVPFLTQVAANRFQQVDVAGDQVVIADGGSTTTLKRVRFTLTDVVTADSFRNVTAGGLDGVAGLGYDDISRQIKMPLRHGGGDRVALDASQRVYGQTIHIMITGVPHIDPAAQTFTLTEPKAELAGQAVPDAIVRLVMQDVARPARITLPMGLRATGITATADGLDVGVTGRDVPLSR